MTFEWDPVKSEANGRKHGINFEAVFSFDWESALVADRTRASDGEQRFAALGFYEGKLHTVVFTPRRRNIRIISMRRSNTTEEKAYDAAKIHSRK